METLLNIYWTRHAESCSNYDQKHYLQQIKDIEKYRDELGYELKEDLEDDYEIIGGGVAQSSSRTTIEAAFRYHPPLSFIGMQQAIKLGTDFYKDKQIDVVYTSSSLRTIMTALLAFRHKPSIQIIVSPHLNEVKNVAGTHDYQNMAISKTKLKNMVTFIKDWLNRYWFLYYDDIQLIEILQKIKKIFSNISADTLTIQIIANIDAILNCKKNMISRKSKNDNTYHIDFVRCINIEPKIKTIIDLLNTYLSSNQNIIIYNLYIELTNLINIDFNLPNVDFTLLENWESTLTGDASNLDLYYSSNILDFLNLLKTELNKQDITSEKSICVVGHGSMLKSYINNIYSMGIHKIGNTDVYQNLYHLDKINNEMRILRLSHKDRYTVTNKDIQDLLDKSIEIKLVYNPKNIRNTYQNFEDLNMNICSLASIKGIINYPLFYEKGQIQNIDDYKQVSGFEDELNDDIKFIYNEINTEKYEKKYLKYKYKYIELKKRLKL